MIYGYARVSTRGQQRNGASLEDQREKLLSNGAMEIYEDAFTGTKMDRPQFDRLLSILKEGDTFMVTKLDRFARTAPEGAMMVRSLVEKGIKVHILNMGVMDNTPMGKLLVTVMLAFAEFERDMIVERTQAGKAIKREDPKYREGRPPVEIDNVLYNGLLKEVESGLISVSTACQTMNISRSKWYRIGNQRCVREI